MDLEAVVGKESSFFSLGSKLRKYALALSFLAFGYSCGSNQDKEEPTLSACASDSECKGNRICREGKCVDSSPVKVNNDYDSTTNEDNYQDESPDSGSISTRDGGPYDGGNIQPTCNAEDSQPCGTTDVGECVYGTQTCQADGTWGECIGNIESLEELCDNKDNDCDGSTDEENACGILFVDSENQIAMIKPDGSERTRLTNTATRHHYPKRSPDGQKIAYVVFDGRVNLEVMGADGNNVRRLLSDLGSGDYSNYCLRRKPSWSPDSTMLTISKEESVYVVTVGSGSNQQITTAHYDCLPEWSPNGQMITFGRGGEGFPSVGSSIYTMTTTGESQTKRSPDSGNYREPYWSPDSSKVVFVEGTVRGASEEQYYDTDLEIVELNNGNFTKLTNLSCGREMSPVWSPAGNKISFVCYNSEGSSAYVVNNDGSSLVKIASDPQADDLSSSIAWSPDGQRIAFLEDSDLYVSSSDGSNKMFLTEGVQGNLDWKP